MGVIDTLVKQIEVWRAWVRLGAADDGERAAAMDALRSAGEVAVPYLRLTLSRPGSKVRAGFAAAVVLQQLGHAEGLAMLIDTLRSEAARNQATAAELEKAFVQIGAPAATMALLQVWREIPDWTDGDRTLTIIAHVWAAMRDPHVLDALTARAQRIPRLFEQTMPAFGEMAVLHLWRMSREPDPERRLLAIAALRHIATGRSFGALTPLLCDPEPRVRSAVPVALEQTGGPLAAAREIAAAIRKGYSSEAAVLTLAQAQAPDLPDLMVGLVSRWQPRSGGRTGDTMQAANAALKVLSERPAPAQTLVPAMCALLEREPEPELGAAAARLITLHGLPPPTLRERSVNALLSQLTRPDEPVRLSAAAALDQLGLPVGRQLCALLEASRPHERVLSRVQSAFTRGADPVQAATDAVQQVTQWVARVSRDAATRIGSGASHELPADAPSDPRLPELTRRLLRAALFDLGHAETPERTAQMIGLCVTACRALVTIGPPDALSARSELTQAIHLVKHTVVYGPAAPGGMRSSERREVAEEVRLAAADALSRLDREECYRALIQALQSEAHELHISSATALGRLGDVRAIPLLQPLTRGSNPALAEAARQALAAIRKEHPEMMTLLRGASESPRPDTLLRPAAPDTTAAAEGLLRPADSA